MTVPRVDVSTARRSGPYPRALNVSAASRRRSSASCAAAAWPATSRRPRRPSGAGPALAPAGIEFFDIGAHIGLYAALAAVVFPPDLVHVTAFEPTPTTADVALALVHRNQLDVTVERLALSDEQGEAVLYVSDKAETSNSLAVGFRSAAMTVTVPTTTLDAYCVSRGYSRP